MVFVNQELACRLETAHAWRGVQYARAQGLLHPECHATAEAITGGYAIYAGAGSPANRAVGLGQHGPVRGPDMELVEQFYQKRDSLPRIDLCPLADPSLLPWTVGYRLEGFHSVLFKPTQDEERPGCHNVEVRISRARPEDAELWIATVAQGFSGQDEPPQETLDVISPTFCSAETVCFLAWIGNEPVGGAAVIWHGGVAELGSGSTRTAYRRRGVQAALLQAGVAAAREAGNDVAMVLTSPASDSQRNVERAGFRLAYTKAQLVRGGPDGRS